jgi:spore coat protein CotF
MPALLNMLLGKENAQQSDQVIANTGLAAAKSAASAYLLATLESATPELRRLYGEYLNQAIAGHATLLKLAVEKGWYKPYDAPESQLQMSFQQSQQLLSQIHQS